MYMCVYAMKYIDIKFYLFSKKAKIQKASNLTRKKNEESHVKFMLKISIRYLSLIDKNKQKTSKSMKDK